MPLLFPCLRRGFHGNDLEPFGCWPRQSHRPEGGWGGYISQSDRCQAVYPPLHGEAGSSLLVTKSGRIWPTSFQPQPASCRREGKNLDSTVSSADTVQCTCSQSIPDGQASARVSRCCQGADAGVASILRRSPSLLPCLHLPPGARNNVDAQDRQYHTDQEAIATRGLQGNKQPKLP